MAAVEIKQRLPGGGDPWCALVAMVGEAGDDVFGLDIVVGLVFQVLDQFFTVNDEPLGRAQGDAIEVLSGLAAGEQVVAVPLGLSDGARVKVAS